MGNPAKLIKDVSRELEAYATPGVEEYKKLTSLYLQTMKELTR